MAHGWRRRRRLSAARRPCSGVEHSRSPGRSLCPQERPARATGTPSSCRSPRDSFLHALEDQPRLGPGLEVDQRCVAAATEVTSFDHLETRPGHGTPERLFIVDEPVLPHVEGCVEHLARGLKAVISQPSLIRPVTYVSLQDIRQIDGGRPDHAAWLQDAMAFFEIEPRFVQGQVLNEVLTVDEIDRGVFKREPSSHIRPNVCSMEDVKILPIRAQAMLHPAAHIHLDLAAPPRPSLYFFPRCQSAASAPTVSYLRCPNFLRSYITRQWPVRFRGSSVV